MRALLTHEVHEQRMEGDDLHLGHALDRGTGHGHPLLEAEDRLLAGVGGDAEDDPVEQAGRAGDDVRVPVGDGIEGAGIDDGDHEASPQDETARILAATPGTR